MVSDWQVGLLDCSLPVSSGSVLCACFLASVLSVCMLLRCFCPLPSRIGRELTSCLFAVAKEFLKQGANVVVTYRNAAPDQTLTDFAKGVNVFVLCAVCVAG